MKTTNIFRGKKKYININEGDIIVSPSYKKYVPSVIEKIMNKFGWYKQSSVYIIDSYKSRIMTIEESITLSTQACDVCKSEKDKAIVFYLKKLVKKLVEEKIIVISENVDRYGDKTHLNIKMKVIKNPWYEKKTTK